MVNNLLGQSSDPGDPPSPVGPAFQSLDPQEHPWLTGEVQKLHPQFVRKEILAGWITTGVLALGSGFGLAIFLFGDALSGAIQAVLVSAELIFVGLLCWAAQCWPPIDYRHRAYRVSESGVQVRKGVLWRTVCDVPHTRVQHMDVNQGPIERKFGLANLVLHTAGTTSASVKLEGLGYDTAVAIRDHLISAARAAQPGSKGDEGDAV